MKIDQDIMQNAIMVLYISTMVLFVLGLLLGY